MKIYLDKNDESKIENIPFGWEVAEWADVCHNKEDFIWVRHSDLRSTSRHNHVERKNKWLASYNETFEEFTTAKCPWKLAVKILKLYSPEV